MNKKVSLIMLSIEHLKGSRTEQHVLTEQLTKQASDISKPIRTESNNYKRYLVIKRYPAMFCLISEADH